MRSVGGTRAWRSRSAPPRPAIPGEPDVARAEATIHAALAAGVTLLD